MARQSNDELTVHGIKVDSINEKFIALALDKAGFSYAYQYYVGGGTNVRGGQIVDFLVYTAPKPTPTFVSGDYWHSGKYSAETALKEADLNARMRGSWAEAVIIYEHECETEEDAAKAVREKLGTG